MTSWLRVWTRAVIVPAYRRVVPVWLGAAIVGGMIFGGAGTPPSVLTDLALHVPFAGCLLAATWLLLFLPAARLVVRADEARYLRSLPAPRWIPRAVAAVALIALQLPWVAFWVVGEHARGLVVVVVATLPIAAVALWRARPPSVGSPRWRGSAGAIVGVYLRGLRRRAIDALVRAVGLAILAGLVAGLFVRNNEVHGRDAGILATTAIAIVLLPGWAGALLPLVDTHRTTAWLAHALGISDTVRVAALGASVALVYTTTMVVAVVASWVLIPDSGAWIAVIGLITSAGLSLVVTRTLVWADRSESAPGVRIVVGAIAATALAVIILGLV